MADAACFVCFRSGRCDLDRAAKLLADRKLNVVRQDSELAVSFPGGPLLRLAYADGDYVAAEAAEIATRNPHAVALLPCDARFEILIDDLDAVLDEYHTLFFLQETLEEATGGFLFNTWNGLFPGRECNP